MYTCAYKKPSNNFFYRNLGTGGIDEQSISIIVFISVKSKMGRGQVVRQRVLVPLFGGSNPSVPEYMHS